jgi:hypothetical protein
VASLRKTKRKDVDIFAMDFEGVLGKYIDLFMTYHRL